MSLRRPSCSARIESPSARVTMCSSEVPEKRAPALPATAFTTAWSPRVTSTSVTASPIDLRLEIASRCACPLMLALAINVSSSRRLEDSSTGPATAIAVVEGQLADDIDRRAVEMRKALRQLCAHLDFDLVCEPSDHLAEGQDSPRRCSVPGSGDRSHATARAPGFAPCRAKLHRRDPRDTTSTNSSLQTPPCSGRAPARTRHRTIAGECEGSVKPAAKDCR